MPGTRKDDTRKVKILDLRKRCSRRHLTTPKPYSIPCPGPRQNVRKASFNEVATTHCGGKTYA
jgi:hypothetical protein